MDSHEHFMIPMVIIDPGNGKGIIIVPVQIDNHLCAVKQHFVIFRKNLDIIDGIIGSYQGIYIFLKKNDLISIGSVFVQRIKVEKFVYGRTFIKIINNTFHRSHHALSHKCAVFKYGNIFIIDFLLEQLLVPEIGTEQKEKRNNKNRQSIKQKAYIYFSVFSLAQYYSPLANMASCVISIIERRY